ncbi:MAG: hypothetical protein M3R68_03790 [Acidobacteriota bacterium]|nr:hypothetical protein [Acidobacteriota bacterium]
MVSSGVGSFTKQAACPSSKILLEYRLAKLAPEMGQLVEWHLEECDFCWSEVKLLTHHAQQGTSREEVRPPSIPVNLRMLAEALLFSRRPRQLRPKKQAKR